MKYLVALVIVVGLVAILRAQRRRQRMAKSASRPPEPAAAPSGSAPARMLRCATCGVHLPVDEALMKGEKAFCSEEHRLQHRPPAKD